MRLRKVDHMTEGAVYAVDHWERGRRFHAWVRVMTNRSLMARDLWRLRQGLRQAAASTHPQPEAPMTVERVERVAKALFEIEKPRYFSDGSLITWEKAITNCHEGRLSRLRRAARTAISAIECSQSPSIEEINA